MCSSKMSMAIFTNAGWATHLRKQITVYFNIAPHVALNKQLTFRRDLR